MVVSSPTGASLEYSVDGTNWQSGTTFAGLIPGDYTVIVRSTVDTTCETSSVSPVTIDAVPGAPVAPVASATVQPTCALPTGTIEVSSPTGASLEYSIDGTNWQAGTTFAGLNPGGYTVSVRDTNDTTCVSTGSSITIDAVPTAPSVPTVASVVQPTCALPSGTITFDTQAGVEYSIGGAFQSSETFAGVAPGTYTLTVRSTVDNTCTTDAASTVTIDAVPTAPSAPVASATVQPTCAVPTGTLVVSSPTGASLEYSVDGTNWQSGTTFAGLIPGDYTVIVRSTVDTTCETSSVSPVTIDAVPGAPVAPVASATVQPTCALPTGTIEVSSPTGASLEYSIDGTNWQAGTTFAGLNPGGYTVSVRDTNDTTCVSTGSSITIDAVPTAPSVPTVASVVQPTCDVQSGTITFDTQAGVEYSIGGAFQSSETFAGVAPGTYTLTVRSTVDNTCTTDAASTVTIDAVPTAPSAPVASATVQPTCAVPTGTLVVSSPTGASLEYSVDGTNWQSGTTFAGLIPGDYTVIVRSTVDTTCETSSVSPVTIDAVPGAPVAPVASATVQPTCALPTGTIEVSSPTGASLEYSIDGTNWQAGTTFAGLNPGGYTVSVRDTNDTTCVSTGSSITIDAVPTAPSVPTVASVVQPTCDVQSGTITFDTQAGVEYSIGGAFQSSETFAGVAPGTYTLTVRSTVDNTCTTDAASTVTIDAVPTAPSAPVASATVQPTCAVPTGTLVVSSPTGASLEYSVDGTNWQSGTTFAGLIPGDYTVIVRSTVDTTCETSSVSPVTIDAVPGAPVAPVASATVQPTCALPTGTIEVSSPTGASLEYSIDGTNWQAGTTFAGLNPGGYTVSVRDTNDTTCVSTGSSITIDAVPTAPSVPTVASVVQPTCDVQSGTITFDTQAGVEYSIGGAFQSSETFAGVAPGTYTLTVRSTVDNTCTTDAASTVTIDAVPTAPSAPVASATVQPTCAVPTGTLVVSSPTGASLEYSVDGTNWQSGTTFAGLIPGDYTVIVRSTVDTTCETSSVSPVTIDAVPGAPVAPVASATVQPTCALPTGTIEVSSPTGASLEYSIDGTNWQAGTTFAGLNPGGYTVSVRDTNDTTCVSTGSSITIDAVPTAPSVPTVASVVQPTCDVQSGTITFDTQAGVEYSIGGAFQSSETFAGVAPGTYTLTVRSTVDNTCTTDAASTVTIDAVPTAPSAPVASATVQPTCAVPTGTLVVSSPTGASLEYSVDGTNWQSGTTFAGLIPGDYTVIVRSTVDTTCETSSVSPVTIDAVPGAPVAPVASATVQPTCALPTGTIEVSSPTGASLEYSIDGTNWQAGTTFAGLNPGGYTVSVRDTNDTTCVSTGSSITIDAVPTAPSVPTVASVVQPTCACTIRNDHF